MTLLPAQNPRRADRHLLSFVRGSETRAEEKLEALLLEGLNSGTPIEVTSAYWEKRRTQLIERHKKKQEGGDAQVCGSSGTPKRAGKQAMALNSVQEIERAIAELKPQQLAELYAWLDRHRPAQQTVAPVFEQGLGLFGSAEDAALLDEVVQMAYEERRRPSGPVAAL